MSTELDDLYQEVILDHNRQPKNFHALENARRAEGYNPLCGDRLTVFMRVDNDVITDVAFQGAGCAISKASASLMTESIKGKTVEQAKRLFEGFQQMVTASADRPAGTLGKLEALAGVRQFPIRVKCATLAWHTMQAALEARENVVSTE